MTREVFADAAKVFRNDITDVERGDARYAPDDQLT
jgi:hypothetical protein